MKKQIRTIAAAALLTVALGSTNTFADQKNHPGAFCQPFSAFEGSKIQYSLGKVNSINKLAVSIECPIVNDKLTGIRNGVVSVVDRNPADRVSCTIRALRANNGDATRTISTRSVTTSNAFANKNATHLSFGKLANPGAHGYYSMSCRLPGTGGGSASSITHYETVEN